MTIESINTGMTALQFSRALASIRNVETSAATGSSAGEGRSSFSQEQRRGAGNQRHDIHVALPARLHWGYRATVVNGRTVAQRMPQGAAGDCWRMVNSVG